MRSGSLDQGPRKPCFVFSSVLLPLSLVPAESPTQQVKQTCVRKSLICAFAIAFIISVMLIAANQVLRSGMK